MVSSGALRVRAASVAGVLVLVAVATMVTLRGYGGLLFGVAAGLAIAGGLIYLAWHADPAWTLSGGLLLAPFSGNWDQLGIPAVLGPDRIVMFTGLVAIMLRAPGSLGRPPLLFRPVHWLLLVTVLYALASAAASGTLLDVASFAVLFERLGVSPFLVFLCAPAAFRTERQRRVLLIALIVLGAYLGLTALFETIPVRSLIFPRYIADPTYGILPDRARGPFVEPATFGLALFSSLGACVMGLLIWRRVWIRLVLVAIASLCAAGLVFTLTRQVWVATIVACALVGIVVPRLRWYLAPAAIAGALGVALLLAIVPSLSEKVTERRAQQNTVWDRLNLNRAALNAIEDRPLFGVGWESWTKKNADYFELDPNYPLTNVTDAPIHNVFVAYAAQLGLVGVTLWACGLFLGIGGTLLNRGPPDIQPWRALLAAVFVFYLVVASFEFVQVFSNLIVWLLAGALAAPRVWESNGVRPGSSVQTRSLASVRA